MMAIAISKVMAMAMAIMAIAIAKVMAMVVTNVSGR